MIETLTRFDKDFFLFLNGMHHPVADTIMYWASSRTIWIPLYLFFLFLLIRTYGKRTFILLIGVALLITLSDQISSSLIKNFLVQRLRPCHEPSLAGMVHVVSGCGGKFGFVSSHAANTFALATFLSLLIGQKFKYFTPAVFFWAAFVSYSRIYNGVHYPADVLGGALLGMLTGWLIVFMLRRVTQKI